MKFQNFKGHQNQIIGLKVTAKHLLLPFAQVKSQIDYLQKDFLGKNNEMTLVSEIKLLSQKL